MNLKSTTLGGALAAGIAASGASSHASTIYQQHDILFVESHEFLGYKNILEPEILSLQTTVSDSIIGTLSTFSDEEMQDFSDTLNRGRTRAGQEMISRYETQLQTQGITPEEQAGIIEDFTREYQSFLSQMTSAGELGSVDNIREARISATGMFSRSLSNFHPSVQEAIGDRSIEDSMIVGVSGTLGDAVSHYGVVNLGDYIVCNVVGRQDIKNGVDGGNCGSGVLLQNISVSSVAYIPELNILVGQVEACNGNFFIAFIPQEGTTGVPRDVSESLNQYIQEKQDTSGSGYDFPGSSITPLIPATFTPEIPGVGTPGNPFIPGNPLNPSTPHDPTLPHIPAIPNPGALAGIMTGIASLIGMKFLYRRRKTGVKI